MNPQRVYNAVRRAIKIGVLVRPSACARCGAPDRKGADGRSTIQAHHADYSRPLDVEWICSKCHRKDTPLPRTMGAPAFGEKNGQAKLTADAVLYIRSCGLSGPALAKIFGVNKSTINRVRAGTHWLAAAPDKEGGRAG